ncbi:WW domain-binding protein 11 [Drosophila pseudoobscura]|uniref:WW domain-binding protein 11 n=1 Tax=Drosophila pseudoobscura pseudoobscura TaxID=46245 RepID=A0A6I8VPY7_DROPS|nr:WW domain-binding protein 11 [Drosophila pseudoobscura]
MPVALRCDYIMLGIVFFVFLATCSAELGYQYQQNNALLNSYGAAAQDYGSEGTDGDGGYPTLANEHYHDHADFHKHFYAFEAPYDSTEEADLVETKLASLAQKNLQVVFIKAPENKAVVGALNALAKQTTEDKTAIYVLNKQTDSNELASQLSALKAQHKHKPQVHFVKYRTEAEAAQAQLHIQEQYGGTGSPQPAQASSLGYYPEQQPQPDQDQGYYPEPQSPASPPPRPGYLPPSPQSSYLPTPSPSTSYLPTPLPQTSYLPPVPQPSYLPPAPRPQTNYLPPAPQSSYLPPSPPQAGYLPSLPNYASISQGYNAAGAGSGAAGTLGQIDLPPLPEPQQDLGGSYDDLDERSGRSLRTGFRANERRRSGSRMVFPTELSSSNYYRSQQVSKRRRRAHH